MVSDKVSPVDKTCNSAVQGPSRLAAMAKNWYQNIQNNQTKMNQNHYHSPHKDLFPTIPIDVLRWLGNNVENFQARHGENRDVANKQSGFSRVIT